MVRFFLWWGLTSFIALGQSANSFSPVLDPEFQIFRTDREIKVDGNLEDPGWQGARQYTQWVETNPGDNITPKVMNMAMLTYDAEFLYVGFHFFDPNPDEIRAPSGDRDNVPAYTDYGGIILDTENKGRTAFMFLANPIGVQYDAISSDASGEDSSPDFFWESKGQIVEDGWILELKIPFSTLRYEDHKTQNWGILLYRNYPREFRYQMFTSSLPRDTSCFICNVKPLKGMENLPSGSHFVVTPYLTGSSQSYPEGDLGSPLKTDSPDYEPGLDIKWIPNPNLAIDMTVNPDFSQVESDVAQITANERFALFFPEKRPFFLEGKDLFTTPLRAVYTRTMTSPDWGTRATGRYGTYEFTALAGQDQGGGSVIIPGANGSTFVDQDFESRIALARFRRNGSKGFTSFLATHREVDGGGHNTVLGPDFQWRPTPSDEITGQVLFSSSQTPNRPDLNEEFDGRSLSDYAAYLYWFHRTKTIDYYIDFTDIGKGFRADNGFVPQAGFRKVYGEIGYTLRYEDTFIHRLRLYSFGDYSEDRDGRQLTQLFSAGCGMSGRYNSFMRFRFAREDVMAGVRTFERDQFYYTFDFQPGGRCSQVYLTGIAGDEVDFTHARLGNGHTVNLNLTFQPADTLKIDLAGSRQYLDVDDLSGNRARLFTATVARIQSTYFLSAKSYFRLIAQKVETARNASLYTKEIPDESGYFSGSALFAYKLNWQSLIFLGYGQNQDLSDLGKYEKSGRDVFVKVSYAFQR